MDFTELKSKEIIDIQNGRKLGFADDVIIDTSTNKVQCLKVPKATKMFKKPEYIEIKFSDINLIGKDVILVRFDQENVSKESNTKGILKGEFYYSPKVFKKSK